tara:strand:- start:2356 stop:3102 length:747 start_codon:yes stop_codon:yes gene_type:complete
MESLDCLSEKSILLLHKNNLLRSLIESELRSNILKSVKLNKDLEDQIVNKFRVSIGIKDENSYLSWLSKTKMNQDDFTNLALTDIRLKTYCKSNFDHKVETRFLERKQMLDMVVYSLIRLKDLPKVNEIYLRLIEKEESFGELARKFSEGQEKKTRGIVGPAQLENTHPILANHLSRIKPGEIQSPIEIEGTYIIVRLESLDRAKLDDFMREQMREELFNNWIKDQSIELNENILKSVMKDSNKGVLS